MYAIAKRIVSFPFLALGLSFALITVLLFWAAMSLLKMEVLSMEDAEDAMDDYWGD